MTAEQSITDAFLLISCLSLVIQAWGWQHLRQAPEAVGRALLRTATCRVGCAVLYVYVGLNAFWFQWAVTSTTFTVYGVVQVTWWLNMAADVRLKRRATGGVR